MHQFRLALLCLLLVLPLTPAGGLGCAKPRSLPSILLVTLDTTRQDHSSAYGYNRETTPFLSELAASGLRFEAAYSASASTAPSHASLFTSLRPTQHLVLKNGVPLHQTLVTMAERLRSEGYQTAGFVSSFVLDRRFGFRQGFEVYDDVFKTETSSIPLRTFEGHELTNGFDRSASTTTARALDWVRRSHQRGRPLFLFVHYFDAHSPYDPPEGVRRLFMSEESSDLAEKVALYDAEILTVDRSLRRLLEGLRQHLGDEPLLCVVIGDHGEGLMDHGHMEHGLQIYEEQVRVPLVVVLPGMIPGGRAVREPVEMVDILPSILDLAGLPMDEGLSGQSLAAALLGQGSAPSRPVFLFRRHYDGSQFGSIWAKGVQFGVRDGPWKLILGPEEHTKQLFDLDEDPEEKDNVAEARPEVAARLARLLNARGATLESGSGAPPGMSEEDAARLRALGYVR